MKLTNSCLFTLPLIILLSCAGKHGVTSGSDSALPSPDSASAAEETRVDSKNLSSVRFFSADDVREFLKFTAFSSTGGRIAFATDGGTLDSEPFNITDIKVISPVEAEIAVSLPKMGLDGTFTLSIADGKATIEDKKSKRVYKMIEV